MKNISEHCTAVLSRVIFIGFGIQIVLGMLWMYNAFTKMADFDEGIICMGFIAVFVSIAFMFFRSFYGVSIGMAIFGGLSLVTFPMITQCFMTMGAQTVAVTLMLAETTCFLRVPRARSDEKYAYVGVPVMAWLFLGTYVREYLFIGAIPILFFLAGYLFNRRLKRKYLIWIIIALVLVGGCVGLAGNAYLQDSQYMTEHLASRFAWTTLCDAYDRLPDEDKNAVDANQVLYSTYEAVGVERTLIPSMQNSMEEADAEQILGKMISIAWKNNTKRISKEILWDMAGYSMSPLMLQWQLGGRGYNSYSGVNYRQILLPAPKLGRAYMKYGCWWFQLSFVLSAILWILKFTRGFRVTKIYGCVMLSLTCLVMAVGYTMSGAGKLDYRKTAFILCMWLAWIIASAGRQGEGEHHL